VTTFEPHPIPTTQPFWDGLRQSRLLLQYSPSTDRWIFYPRVLAPGSLADDLEWREAGGGGTLFTYTVARKPTAPPWAERLPQLLAVVALDEGPRVTTELMDVDASDLRIGMRVRAVYVEGESTETLLRFAPDPAGA
jgi:uncharacterized OB-fold protein